jgi:hypothetical protein
LHGNPGEVFADQAVTPSQEQVKTSRHSKRFAAGHFSTASVKSVDFGMSASEMPVVRFAG